MQNTTVVLIVLLAIATAVIVWLAMRVQTSTRLKKTFGPEYDRTLEAKGTRKLAEDELVARQKRVHALELRPLSVTDRDRFADRWKVTQASFVDDPIDAVAHADALVDEVMQARGYPVAEFERRAADISVDHPRFVQNYREAHSIALAARQGTAQTEDLRRATIHYRSLFEDLLETAA
jgi:hypothetical protein